MRVFRSLRNDATHESSAASPRYLLRREGSRKRSLSAATVPISSHYPFTPPLPPTCVSVDVLARGVRQQRGTSLCPMIGNRHRLQRRLPKNDVAAPTPALRHVRSRYPFDLGIVWRGGIGAGAIKDILIMRPWKLPQKHIFDNWYKIKQRICIHPSTFLAIFFVLLIQKICGIALFDTPGKVRDDLKIKNNVWYKVMIIFGYWIWRMHVYICFFLFKRNDATGENNYEDFLGNEITKQNQGCNE
jgi:hypothetical protein